MIAPDIERPAKLRGVGDRIDAPLQPRVVELSARLPGDHPGGCVDGDSQAVCVQGLPIGERDRRLVIEQLDLQATLSHELDAAMLLPGRIDGDA